jgi:N-acetylglucosaminyldiphosphoundecaprenol N-acetyl-beta-D-mannosaminyltransferase
VSERLPRRRIFGLDFIDLSDHEPLVEELLIHRQRRDSEWTLPVVVTPNVDQLVHIDRGTDATASRLIGAARYVLPDGQPIVWASTLLGRPLSARLPGSSLLAELWPRLVAGERRSLVVASSERIAERVRADGALAVVAPQLSLADRSTLDELVATCRELVADHDIEFVFVTLGFPKQCNVIDGLLHSLGEQARPTCLAVGASFDMYYGMVRRAPDWMQRTGLEWLFRFVQEPRRLFRRYFVDDPSFVALVWREWRSMRQADRPPRQG